MVVGDAAVIVPVKGPTQSPSDGHPGGVGHERFVDRHRSIDVDDLRVILRHIDDLGIGWLDPDDVAVLHVDLLVIVGQHPLGIGLAADQLDGIVDVFLLEVDRLTQAGRPGDVLGHHFDHIPKLHERDDRRIPVLDRLGGRFFQIGVLEKELVGLDHVERAGGGGQDLGQKLIRVEGDRSDQLFEFVHRAPEVVGFLDIQLRDKGGFGLVRGGGGGHRRCGRGRGDGGIRNGRRELGLGTSGDHKTGGGEQGQDRPNPGG